METLQLGTAGLVEYQEWMRTLLQESKKLHLGILNTVSLSRCKSSLNSQSVCVCIYIYTHIFTYIWGFPGGSVVKSLLAMQEMLV